MTMLLPTAQAVLDALRNTPILSGEVLERIRRELPTGMDDPQELAKWLIRQNYLTLYQGRKLIQGKASELIVGPFVLLDKIGEGGMGKVYKATQARMGRFVALKVVRAQLLANIVALRRFQREARAAAQLSHPNIVRVFDAGDVGDVHFLAMELVEGTDLAKLVKSQGPLPVALASNYIRQAALGLQHAHENGIIHRDIKPGNLLVDREGVVKILDMGLARPQATEDEESVTALTQDGTVVGTPDFMAPEQAKNSSTVDHRADLYSLGCTWFFLLTGKTLFPTGTTLEKLLKHQMDPPPPLSQYRKDVPIAVEAILWKLLAKSPADRWQNAQLLADALAPLVGKGTLPSAIPVDEPLEAAMQPTMAIPATPPTPVPPAAPPPFQTASAVLTPPNLSRPASSTMVPSVKTIASPFDFEDEPQPPTPPARPARPATAARKRKALPRYAILLGAGAVLLLAVGTLIALRPRNDDAPTKTEQIIVASPPTTTAKAKAAPAPAPPTPNVEAALPIDRYFPEDASGALTIRLDPLLNGPLFQQFGPDVEAVANWLTVILPFDPRTSLERCTFVFPADDPNDPLVIVQGKWPSGPVQEWLQKQREQENNVEVGGRMVVIYEFTDQLRDRPIYVALTNPSTLLLCSDRTRLMKSLGRESFARKPTFRDPLFTTQIGQVDRNALLWGTFSGRMSSSGERLSEQGILTLNVRGNSDAKSLQLDLEVEGRNRRVVGEFMLKWQGALQLGVLSDSRLAPLAEVFEKMTIEEISGRPFRMRFHYEIGHDRLAKWLRAIRKMD